MSSGLSNSVRDRIAQIAARKVGLPAKSPSRPQRTPTTPNVSITSGAFRKPGSTLSSGVEMQFPIAPQQDDESHPASPIDANEQGLGWTIDNGHNSNETQQDQRQTGKRRGRDERRQPGGRGGNNNKYNNNNNNAAGPGSNGTIPATVGGVVPSETLDDMGGLQKELPLFRELIEMPCRHPNLFVALGADPPSGILLHGPPGVGKSRLVRALAGTFKVPLFSVSAPEIVQGIAGDSEATLRALFLEAVAQAPAIIFIDEIDTIAGHRENASREMEKRIVAQLLVCMDQLSAAWREEHKVVMVVGATNRPEAIDSGLRRAGRFDREIALGIPTTDERHDILRVLTKTLSLSSAVDLHKVAMSTPGYVGADLQLLIKEGAVLAIRRKYRELSDANELDDVQSPRLAGFCVEEDDIKEALTRVQPSAMREGFTTIPNVTWDDVGALEEAREELKTSILQPICNPKLHRRFGLDHPTGICLCGPPGCGKTLIAKAIASESGANFISIKGPELLNKFVGESERSVRQVFARGRASAPCVLFFDELDALAPRRGSDRANPSSERVVNQLLTELDGVDGRAGVFVVAATNRPDMIDPAMLRPGRLDKILFVPMPNAAQRASILKTCARKFPVHPDVDLHALGTSDTLEGFSGADLASIVREASLNALKEVYRSMPAETINELERRGFDAKGNLVENVAESLGIEGVRLPYVMQEHFDAAAKKIVPSVSMEERERYEEMYRHHMASRRKH